MSVKTKNIEMCSGPLFKNILKFVFPLILTDFFTRLYNAVDVMVVGRYASREALAGVGSTTSLISLFLNFFLGLSIGVGVVLGHALGAKNDEKAHRVVHTSVLLSFIFGAILSVFGVIFAEPMLKLTGVPDDVMPHARIYMQIIFAGKLPSLVYVFGAAMLRAKGDAKTPLYIAMATGLVNALLNLLFVLKFKMSSDGVALATTIAQLISAVWVLAVMCKADGPTKLYFNKLKIYKRQLVDILKIGVPSGMQSVIFAISNVIIQSGVNSFGAAAIAGSAASSNIGGFYYGALHAVSQGCTAFVSQNMGAKNFKRISKSVIYCIINVCFIWFITGILTIFARNQLIGMYIPGDIEAVKYGVTRLAIVGGTYGLCGLMDTMSGALRGIGKSFTAMIISVTGVCGIRLVWIFTAFKTIGTFSSLFVCFPLSWFGTFAMHTIMFVIIKKALDKKHKNEIEMNV